MKKILSTLSLALVAVAMFAQQAVITFTKTEHDFGKIQEADGRVTTIFQFKNEGMEPLVLSNVRASCGCTTPKWTKEPINPGETGEITVTYNPNGRPGRFQKTITVTSNAKEATTKLYIKGEVIPKPAQSAFSVKMGDLYAKSNTVNYGNVKMGQLVTRDFEYTNKGGNPVKVAVMWDNKYLDAQVSLPEIKANESGKITFAYNTKAAKGYGPKTLVAYLVLNGKTIKTDEYKITINIDVEEDFSTLTTAQKQQAPIFEIPNTVIDLGQVEAGKSVKKSITFRNAGINPLIIRRLFNNQTEYMTCSATNNVKSNKSGTLTIAVKAVKDGKPMEKSQYTRTITVYTNDPGHAKQVITIKWTVK